MTNMSPLPLVEDALTSAMTYPQYINLVHELAQRGASTGPNQSEAYVNYTKLNDRRMKRWSKVIKLTEDHIGKIQSQENPITWLVITESWCGDASPALPVMQKIAEVNAAIDLKIILRDTDTALIDAFLTNGGRSIPKLIQYDHGKKAITGTWGPRSAPATTLVMDEKAAKGGFSDTFKQELQQWYNNDKGQSILKELMALLPLE